MSSLKQLMDELWVLEAPNCWFDLIEYLIIYCILWTSLVKVAERSIELLLVKVEHMNWKMRTRKRA